VVQDAVVNPDPATLLHWAARDADRQMLYATAVTVVVP
jgi:hypothetical protein